MKRTGIKRQPTISNAVNSLEAARFLTIVRDRKGSTKRGAVSSEYTLTQPDTGEPIPLSTGGRNILGPNKIPYFTISTCLLTSAAHWSLAQLENSEVRLYVAMLWRANVERAHEFTSTNVKLCKLTGLTRAPLKKALDGLQRNGLIYVSEGDFSNKLGIQLCDPFTGEPMHIPDGNDESDPANYFTTDSSGVTRRFTWNTGSVEQNERLIRDSVPAGDPVIEQSSGDLFIPCPFHHDTTPSCSVSPAKSCFRCFGCGVKGNLSYLIEKMTGGSRSSTIKRIAIAMGQAVEFHQPDFTAIASYDYRDRKGNLLKRVLRFPNREDGTKSFSQRRWTKDGWVPGLKYFAPMLYNVEWLDIAGTVCILEGEKDAKCFHELRLMAPGGLAVGVTSGGAGSWDVKLAKLLRGKHVIVMPDNDTAGEAYAEAVRASLDAEHIEYKTVSFAGSGAKDVSEYLEQGNRVEDLVSLIDSEWVRMPDGSLPGGSEEFDEAVEI